MEFTTFVRKPFTVEAVEITEENMAELAPNIGKLRRHQDGTPYIYVDRRKVPSLDRVYVGFWMTRMGDNIRCYSKRVFNSEFSEVTPQIQSWLDSTDGPMHEQTDTVEELPQPDTKTVLVNVLEREDYSNPNSVD